MRNPAFGWIVLIGAISPGHSQSIEQHRLTVAANNTLNVGNAEVDNIITQMNQLIAKASYPWDVACPNVTFIRYGNVIRLPTLKSNGTYDELSSDLRQKAPAANVLVVSKINCNGAPVAGCGTVSQEPLVVGTTTALFAPQLWLHERGHNVGLQHATYNGASTDGGLDTDYPAEVGMRIMFWQLGTGHLGKTALECAQFGKTLFASTIAIAGGVGLAAPHTVLTAASGEPSGAQPLAVAAAALPPEQPDDELQKLASAVNLTPQAFRVVGPPWTGGIPFAAIRKLSPADLDSIRTMLKGAANPYWSQALLALAAAGNENDVALITKALNLPAPAAPPGPPTNETIIQTRTLAEVKLSAPIALGILANRTGSETAVKSLWDTAHLARSKALIGNSGAADLSKNSIQGLTYANTPQADSFYDAALALDGNKVPQHDCQSLGPSGKNVSPSKSRLFAPLSACDVEKLETGRTSVKAEGIEAYLSPPPTG